eukprot:1161702-Pleurochrysis_carterae.AAC.1
MQMHGERRAGERGRTRHGSSGGVRIEQGKGSMEAGEGTVVRVFVRERSRVVGRGELVLAAPPGNTRAGFTWLFEGARVLAVILLGELVELLAGGLRSAREIAISKHY